MTVYDLNESQMEELKQAYVTQISDDGISYGELAAAAEIPDDIIYNHYDGVIFSEDDFVS